MTQWYGLLAPIKWPRANIARLEANAIKAARSVQVRDKLAQETALAVGNTGAEFNAFIKTEQARWKAVMRAPRSRWMACSHTVNFRCMP